MNRFIIKLLLVILFAACKKNDLPPVDNSTMYFPPVGSSTWQTTTPESLGWNTAAIPALKSFLQSTNTKAFIVLKNGRIVLEAYFGKQLNGADFTASSLWYWASAGKTLTASTVGIAQHEGFLQLDKPTSTYLGAGWTSLPAAQENLITVKHQITMTTGLDDGVADAFCTLPSCLIFKAAPGTRWAYHNAPYTLLDKVIAAAAGQTFSNYFNTRLRDKIGMDGTWIPVDYNNVYYSTARSMARFGLLMLNKGIWNGEAVIKDANYFAAMTTTSQTLNQSYGYLWWLNGKSSFMFPGSQAVVPVSLSPLAPADMIAAMGKNGQLVNVVPSQNIIMIRMGEDPASSLVPFTYQNQLWEKLNEVIK